MLKEKKSFSIFSGHLGLPGFNFPKTYRKKKYSCDFLWLGLLSKILWKIMWLIERESNSTVMIQSARNDTEVITAISTCQETS